MKASTALAVVLCRTDVISVDEPRLSTGAPSRCHTAVGSWGNSARGY
jgi:hypothetical protein